MLRYVHQILLQSACIGYSPNQETKQMSNCSQKLMGKVFNLLSFPNSPETEKAAESSKWEGGEGRQAWGKERESAGGLHDPIQK